MTNNAVQKNADIPGQSLAILAESLYLINLLLLPGIAFLILAVLFFKYESKAPSLAGCHLRQTFSASIWAGLVLILLNGVILLIGGYQAPYTWVIVILNFVLFHATFVFLGIFGLVNALVGKGFHYPLIGPTC
ncbi:MAG: hypothetical protein DRR08_07110 [Candidatus Parabeggiatoa sp. nov. 2]|nr:MAG: hypothetical protein B6247_16555 [Beggiatoa sp. 4572_84]RKZ62045.1 MAG: hypothetical protein DRR08_07110 [Gammaproteobacteria bacterium]